jgi:hypothetical protein
MTKDDDPSTGPPAPLRFSGQTGRPVPAATGPFFGPLRVVAAVGQNPLARNRNHLLVRKLSLSLLRFVVAVDSDHWSDVTELVRHPQLPHVAGLKDQIDTLQRVENRSGQAGTAL